MTSLASGSPRKLATICVGPRSAISRGGLPPRGGVFCFPPVIYAGAPTGAAERRPNPTRSGNHRATVHRPKSPALLASNGGPDTALKVQTITAVDGMYAVIANGTAGKFATPSQSGPRDYPMRSAWSEQCATFPDRWYQGKTPWHVRT